MNETIGRTQAEAASRIAILEARVAELERVERLERIHQLEVSVSRFEHRRAQTQRTAPEPITPRDAAARLVGILEQAGATFTLDTDGYFVQFEPLPGLRRREGGERRAVHAGAAS